MKNLGLTLFVVFFAFSVSLAQEAASPGSEKANEATVEQQAGSSESAGAPTAAPAAEAPSQTPSVEADLAGKARELAAEAQTKVGEIAEKVDQNESAKKAAEGILGPIYKLAESLNFAAFHWMAFGLMAAGVVSFALQLVLGKLVVLFKGSINLREILSDAIGFIISVLGLVLTTQAAAENSTFTHSPAAVLSAAALGVVVGFMMYRWGQAQEVNAVTGSRVKPEPKT